MEIDVLRWDETSRNDSTDLAADITSLRSSVKEESSALPLSPDDQLGHLAKNASTSVAHFLAPVQFSGMIKSPLITMPPLSVLKSSLHGTSSAPNSAVFLHPTLQLNVTSPNRTHLSLGYLVFANVGQLIDIDDFAVANSHVVSVYVGDGIKSINYLNGQSINLTFFHLEENGVFKPFCVSDHFLMRGSGLEYCRLISTSREKSECACTLLGRYAMIYLRATLWQTVSSFIYLIKVPTQFASILLAYIALVKVGSTLSVVCLALSLLAFTFFRSLYSVRNTVHRNLCFSLLVCYLILLISECMCCAIVAMLGAYFDLVAYCWMLMEGYQLYLSLIRVFESNNSRILPYYLFSYGFPAVVSGVTVSVAWRGTNQYDCTLDPSSLSFFAVPMLIMILANVIILVIALRVVLSVKSRDRSRIDRLFGWLKGFATLLCLLGVTQSFSSFAVRGNRALSEPRWEFHAWIVVFLSLQGVFIFILLVVLNEKVRSTVMQWLRSNVRRLRNKISADNSSSAATTTCTGNQLRPLSSPRLSDVIPSAEDRSCTNSYSKELQLDNLGGLVKKQLNKTAEVPARFTKHQQESKLD